MENNLVRQMVDRIGLEGVARKIGRSKSAVCHVLRGTYKGNPDNIIALVERAFSVEAIECPVLGNIPLNRCIEEQGKPFAVTNRIRVALARTCPACEKKRP